MTVYRLCVPGLYIGPTYPVTPALDGVPTEAAFVRWFVKCGAEVDGVRGHRCVRPYSTTPFSPPEYKGIGYAVVAAGRPFVLAQSGKPWGQLEGRFLVGHWHYRYLAISGSLS